MIDHCSYGTMTVNLRSYTNDLLIFPDGKVADNGWRTFDQRLAFQDIAQLVRARPDIIVVGLGTDGQLQLSSGLTVSLAQYGIQLIAEPTKAAARTFNALWHKKIKVGGYFHLDCVGINRPCMPSWYSFKVA